MIKTKACLVAICFLMAILVAAPMAPAAEQAYKVSPKVQDTFSKIMAQPAVKKGLDFIKADHDNTITEQKQINIIPAPPFKEDKRSADYFKRLSALGLKNMTSDSIGNVCGIWPGTGKGPKLLVAAHLDTVFPEGTDVTVKEKDGILYAPGISDNTAGLAAQLSLIRALKASGVKTSGDIMFCGNVGEEGLGDLRGVKAIFRDHKDIDGSIHWDYADVTGVHYNAVGSHRYEITYKGPGGHSFNAFGRPSAIHALGRAIAKIADLKTPENPKTTFTVGVVKGGTSINAIAGEASLLMDMRSGSDKELLAVEAKFLQIVKQAAAEENARWGSDQIKFEIKPVGNRPAGSQPTDAPIVQASWISAELIGVKPKLMDASSTDMNLPISLGIPAVTLGSGGKEANNHALTEWFDPKDSYQGPQRVFLTVLGLVGIDGVTEPLLPKKR
jgi:acetylornithine deacetylase/succinyl-diaminopimelate desuccinylase-like protein